MGLAAAISCLLSASPAPPGSRLKPGAPMPEASFRSVEGRDRTLHQLRGERRDKIVAVAFWAPGCPWSQAVREELVALAKEFGPKGVVVALVDPTPGASAPALAELERSYRDSVPALEVLRDTDRSAAEAFGALTTPDVFVIGSDGKVQYSGRVNDLAHPEKPQAVKRHYLREALEALLVSKAPLPDRTAPAGSGIRRTP